MDASSPTPRQVALGQLGHLVATWAQATVEADGATVTAVEGDHFVYVAATGSVTGYLGRRFALTESFTGEVLATGRSRIFSADKSVAGSRERAAKHSIAQGIVVAAAVGGRPAGTVGVVTSSDSFQYTEANVKQLEQLGNFWARGVAALGMHRWARSPSAERAEDSYVTAARGRLERAIALAQTLGDSDLTAELLGVAMLLERVSQQS